MIRTLCRAAFLLAASAPAFAQQALPPDVQEMIDKIHLGASAENMIAIENVPMAFQRTAAGDYAHKPSGFVCPHTVATLFGLKPAMVFLFDDPNVANDIGCGMVQQDINLTFFVFRRDGDIASIMRDETSASRNDFPPDTRVRQPQPASADDLGIPAGAPFGSEAWAVEGGGEKAIYVTRVGTWYFEANVTTQPETTAKALEQVRRMFVAAHQQIKG